MNCHLIPRPIQGSEQTSNLIPSPTSISSVNSEVRYLPLFPRSLRMIRAIITCSDGVVFKKMRVSTSNFFSLHTRVNFKPFKEQLLTSSHWLRGTDHREIRSPRHAGSK